MSRHFQPSLYYDVTQCQLATCNSMRNTPRRCELRIFYLSCRKDGSENFGGNDDFFDIARQRGVEEGKEAFDRSSILQLHYSERRMRRSWTAAIGVEKTVVRF